LRQAAGKLVHVWAIEADFDPSAVRSNSFPLE
jgi:predicted NUDIX family NTP pyrophosphohydrolase